MSAAVTATGETPAIAQAPKKAVPHVSLQPGTWVKPGQCELQWMDAQWTDGRWTDGGRAGGRVDK